MPENQAIPEFCYVIRPSRKDFLSTITNHEGFLVNQHFDYLVKARDAGTVIYAGRCNDATFGIIAFRAPDESAARKFVEGDPAVAGKVFLAELHPFRTAIMGK
jgi:uncharacterized protein YciI